MEMSDLLALGAILISIGTLIWNEIKDLKKKEEQSFVNLAITYRANFLFGIAELGRQIKNSDAYALKINIAIHNVGNANAVVNRVFITEKLDNGNYNYLEELQMEIESQRIIKTGESATYYFEGVGNHMQKIDVLLSKKTAFIRILESSGKFFDSPRN